MAEPLSTRLMHLIPQAMHMYHRLVLVVAPLGAGKTAALREVAQQTGYTYINVNLELSRCMLGLTQRQRQWQVPRLLRGAVSAQLATFIFLHIFQWIHEINQLRVGKHPFLLSNDLSSRARWSCSSR